MILSIFLSSRYIGLNSNSINHNLKKGYVILKKYNQIIKLAKQLDKKGDIQIKFFDKKIFYVSKFIKLILAKNILKIY